MKKSNFLTFLFSIFSGLRISLIGQIFGSEIIALLFFPLRKIRKIISETPIKKTIFPYALFLISLIISDVFVNDTGSDRFLRGWSNILFSFIQVVFLFNLFLKSEKNYLWYLFFSAISFFIFRPQMEEEFNLASNAFKIYFMFGVNYLIILIAFLSRTKSKILPSVIFLLYAIFCFVADARSNGVVYFLAAIIYSFKFYNIKLSLISTFFLTSLLLSTSYAGYSYYVSKVVSGEINGNNSQQILRLENPYNPFELLKEGRADALFTLIPIMDKPIMGFGSWAEDRTGRYNILYDKFTNADRGKGRLSNLIPAHSILLAGWLWAGVGGFVGVFLLYFRIFKLGILLFFKTNSRFLILIVPLLLDQVWNFLFSPIGHIRQTAPFVFSIIFVEYYRYSKMVSNKKEKI